MNKKALFMYSISPKIKITFQVFFWIISLQAYAQNAPIFSTAGKYFFIDYKPFFPIGLYDFPEKRNDDAIWKEAAEAGINFKLSKEPGKYGIWVSNPIPKVPIDGKNRSLMELQYGKDIQNQLKAYLNKYESDTTTICWHAPDEPSWFGPSGQILMNGYDYMKRNSKKPVWLNIGPSFTNNTEHYNNPQTYIATCDVISEDIYPVPDGKPKTGQGSNRDMIMVGEHTSKIVNMAKINQVQQKPAWMVLQGFGWASLNKTFKNPETYVPPTKPELRFMVYDAIVNGATGIVFWGLEFEKQNTPTGKEIWMNVKEMSSELKANYSILTSMTEVSPKYLSISTADTTNNSIKYLMKIVGKNIYVMVVNTKPETQKNVQFKVTDQFQGAVSSVTEISSNKNYPVKDKRIWTEDLEGFGVRIFKTDMNFAFFKP
jgi:hypothetical protein